MRVTVFNKQGCCKVLVGVVSCTRDPYEMAREKEGPRVGARHNPYETPCSNKR